MPNSNKNKQVGYSEKMTMPPLGLISIGGYLKMHGYMVEILDLFTNHIRKQEFIDKIKNAHPDMIGISAYTENINAVIHLTKIIKSVLPKIIIVLGGAHVTFLPEEALHHNTVDYEALWKEFVQSISVAERENRALQNQNLPLRFRTNLVEFSKEERSDSPNFGEFSS